VDEDGLPLPGAYIKLAKTDHSTIADRDGKFSISLLQQKDPVLQISYLGMMMEEVKAGGDRPLRVVMKSDVKSH